MFHTKYSNNPKIRKTEIQYDKFVTVSLFLQIKHAEVQFQLNIMKSIQTVKQVKTKLNHSKIVKEVKLKNKTGIIRKIRVKVKK